MRAIVLALLAAIAAVPGHTTPIFIGELSFLQVSPASPPDPGIVGFEISNYTGDPLLGGYALSPDFPVYTALVLQNLTLTVVRGGSSVDILLGNLGPGVSRPAALQFSDADVIDSVLLTGTLSTSDLALDGGGHVSLAPVRFATSLLPSSGSYLTPDIDSATISLESADVPEPGYGLAVLGLLAPAAIWRRRERR